MGYADQGRVIIGCRACEPQPARFSSVGSAFGSRRGHFDVITNLVGRSTGHGNAGQRANLVGRSTGHGNAGQRANLVGGLSDSVSHAMSEAKGVMDAMSLPMKLGMAAMLLGGILVARGDVRLA